MKKTANLIRAAANGLMRELGSLGKSTKTYVLYGVLYDTMFNLYKPYAPKFVERLGGTALHISLITALPGFFAVIALIPCSVFLTKFADKRKATAVLFALSRAFLLAMALTPFLRADLQAWAFVITLSVMNLPDAVSQASLQGFLGDLFRPRERAGAIAVRSRFGNLATTFALIVSCIALQFAAQGNEQKIKLYQMFYAVAFIVGCAEIYVFLKLKPEKTPESAAPFDFLKNFPDIVRDRKFVTYCAALFLFHFAYFMGFPLSNIMLITELGGNELWVGVSTILNVAAIVASSRYWGRMLTKKGTGHVLALSAAGVSLTCLLISISPNPAFYSFALLVGGWFTCGVNLGVLNGLLEFTPDNGRVVYVGVFQTFVNLALAVAPLVALWVVMSRNIYIALWITSSARLLCGGIIYFIYRKRPLAVQREDAPQED